MHSAPNCVTLIASDHGRVLATITVGFDSPVGMAVGLLYPEEVGTFRSAGARLCEFTRLAVDRSQHSKKLLAMVFHAALRRKLPSKYRADLPEMRLFLRVGGLANAPFALSVRQSVEAPSSIRGTAVYRHLSKLLTPAPRRWDTNHIRH